MSKIKSSYFHFFGDKKLEDLLDYNEICSLQQVAKGTAGEDMQKKAFVTILIKICRFTAPTFNPDQSMQSFNEGMRFVGQLLALAKEADVDNFSNKPQ